MIERQEKDGENQIPNKIFAKMATTSNMLWLCRGYAEYVGKIWLDNQNKAGMCWVKRNQTQYIDIMQFNNINFN